ncbi:hypothetical protein FNV43_RR20601 [Rhamnella rubrinervis]|uniref:Uncharacterized protein n=1 Tax=Rhamnella rubrinervis TaxID=2594499 RepID=A0A8K0GX63_9ROSA|nr:hypothetical protein FNV43_RR20601 [Rhamnella rubrinervis]
MDPREKDWQSQSRTRRPSVDWPVPAARAVACRGWTGTRGLPGTEQSTPELVRSDCLIKTKHCDGLSRITHADFCPVLQESQRKKFNQARVNGGKITLREHPQGPSQCFVLIKQSDSLVRTSSESTVRRSGRPRGAAPSPSPARGDAPPRSSSSSPPTADGFGTGTPCPALRANPFPRLRIHFADFPAYIVPSTRGCSPWRPDAVMSTTGRGRHSVLRIFKGAGAHGHHATCGALPAAGPYLRLSRFQGGQAVKQKR